MSERLSDIETPPTEAETAALLDFYGCMPWHRTLRRLIFQRDSLQAELAATQARAADAMRAVGEMKAIIDRLPRTKDNVPITPGMSVFRPFGVSQSVAELTAQRVCDAGIHDGTGWMHGSHFYSTQEAASDALAGAGTGGEGETK